MTTYTKEERESLMRAVQEIDLFLRLARLRTFTEAKMPDEARAVRSVITWLHGLAGLMAQGEDISRP